MKVLAVIPARGGSKSIPLKNIKMLGGKPLLGYTIDEAKKSKYIDRLVVSTDHSKISELARSQDVEVITRPRHLATDKASTESALIHVLDTLNNGYRPDYVVTLEPTSPLRTVGLIDRCIAKCISSDCDSVITVKETRECLGRMDGDKYSYLIKGQPRRRQDREPLFFESGTVYVTKTEVLLNRNSVLGENIIGVVVDGDEAIDINTPADFAIAEAMLEWKRKEGEGND
ncbi:MAG: acylneuraminate cytidylyltransferase family protein [Nitrospinaceae bacterium]|jgi:CMP-N,N'-diacetyllegionaminic acid synthase|nr:acylneuraminate cytidylyltransferase family protein [Nitrospinaceae bacterium]MBT5366865.1 acylneuraminate cytidylyltransferase family protein [Nitrospinaceae bacterium]